MIVVTLCGLFRFTQHGSSKERVAKALLWGALYAGGYHLWLLRSDWVLWCLGWPYRVGLWLLLPVPPLALRRLLPARLWSEWTESLAWACGLALVTWAQLLTPWGFDWEAPLAALTTEPWTLSLLPWLGLVGLSAVVGLGCTLIAGSRATVRLAGFALLAVWLGLSRLVFASAADGFSPSWPVIGLVQTGWPQELKWAKENQSAAKLRLIEMTHRAAQGGADLIIWPETAWPVVSLLGQPHEQQAVSSLAREQKVTVVVSSLESEGSAWRNTVSQVSPEGEFEARYHKRRLVPLVENALWGFARSRRFLSGDAASVFVHGGLRYAPLVCYESTVPWLCQDLADQVDFFAVVTNDATLGSEFAKEAHFRSAILRAIECRRPVLQASNDGVSGVVDARGVVRQRSRRGVAEAALLLVDVQDLARKRKSLPDGDHSTL